MARRPSHRQRIARKADEAEAGRRQRAGKRAPPAPPRMKIVWAVKEPSGRTLKHLPYARKEEAEALVARLRERKEREYFLAREKVPFE